MQLQLNSSGNSEQKETSYTENITESAKIETNTYVPPHQEVASINNENTKSSVKSCHRRKYRA